MRLSRCDFKSPSCGNWRTQQQSGYEKDHETSAIISAIKAAKSISRLDRRIRRLPFFLRRHGVPLTASTNKMSFTSPFYQPEGPETAE